MTQSTNTETNKSFKVEVEIRDSEAVWLFNEVMNKYFDMSCWNTYNKEDKKYRGVTIIHGITDKGRKFLKRNSSQ